MLAPRTGVRRKQSESTRTVDYVAASDDEFEYVRGTFKYRKGTTPDQSREDPEAWRATLRDEGGHLAGQAEFIPGDDDAIDDSYDSSPSPSYDDDYSSLRRRRQEISPFAQMIDDVLAEITVRMIKAGFAELKPHAKRWWSESALPAMRSLKDPSSRKGRKVDAVLPDVVEEETRVFVMGPTSTSTEVEAPTMTSTDAQQRLMAAVLAKAFSDKQVRLLLSARIVDADETVGWATLEQVSPAEVESQIGLLLESNPKLLAELFQMFAGDTAVLEPEPTERKHPLPGAGS